MTQTLKGSAVLKNAMAKDKRRKEFLNCSRLFQYLFLYSDYIVFSTWNSLLNYCMYFITKRKQMMNFNCIAKIASL